MLDFPTQTLLQNGISKRILMWRWNQDSMNGQLQVLSEQKFLQMLAVSYCMQFNLHNSDRFIKYDQWRHYLSRAKLRRCSSLSNSIRSRSRSKRMRSRSASSLSSSNFCFSTLSMYTKCCRRTPADRQHMYKDVKTRPNRLDVIDN